ncbi:hypothetical protein N0V90_013385 [Kalmusia sp. IMI 367209]|nr:hypothetical protein N0V90_013385 [Kalmusia sp. IMI 367209]
MSSSTKSYWRMEIKQSPIEHIIQTYTASCYDERASMIQVYGTTQGQYFAINTLLYTEPELRAKVFLPFMSIEPQISDGTRVGMHQDLIANSADAQGLRNTFITTTWTADLDFLDKHVVPAWLAFCNSTAQVVGLQNALLNQALPRPLLEQSSRRGNFSRNIIADLHASHLTPIISLLSLTWLEAADDPVVNSAAKAFIETVESAAQREQKYMDYKYLNYADKLQHVFEGYDSANLAKMKAASKKYDPRGLFQKNLPGGFKIFD